MECDWTRQDPYTTNIVVDQEQENRCLSCVGPGEEATNVGSYDCGLRLWSYVFVVLEFRGSDKARDIPARLPEQKVEDKRVRNKAKQIEDETDRRRTR